VDAQTLLHMHSADGSTFLPVFTIYSETITLDSFLQYFYTILSDSIVCLACNEYLVTMVRDLSLSGRVCGSLSV